MTRLNEQARLYYARERRRYLLNERPGLRPDHYTARECLRMARAHHDSPLTPELYGPDSIWKIGPGNGQPFDQFGGPLRWIEKPESCGLRFVGLAHEVGKAGYTHFHDAVDHTGWWLDPDGLGETVSGVVYQLPGRDGLPRYVVGYADPYNSDRDGRGPAALDLVNVMTGENTDSHWDADPILRDAAQRADGYAERMAESEREYQESWRAGSKAREKGQAALEACKEWIADRRTVCEFFAMRHAMPGTEARRATLRTLVRHARQARDRFTEARAEFHDAWLKHYALYFDGYGFATTENNEFRFTSDPSEALHWDRPTAKALATGIAEGLKNEGLERPARIGLVEWLT